MTEHGERNLLNLGKELRKVSPIFKEAELEIEDYDLLLFFIETLKSEKPIILTPKSKITNFVSTKGIANLSYTRKEIDYYKLTSYGKEIAKTINNSLFDTYVHLNELNDEF